jgi:hypothetical protein
MLFVAACTLAAVLAACGNEVTVNAPKTNSPAPATSSPPSSTSPSGTASTESTTFNGHGVTFQYPADWQPFDVSGTAASQGTQAWSESFGPDEANLVTVSEYAVNIPITVSNIDQHTPELTAQVQGLFTQAGGSMQSGPTKLTMGGFPAVGYSGTAVNPQAISVKTRIILAFNNSTEYFVNCQSSADATSTVDAGCDQVISSFTAG